MKARHGGTRKGAGRKAGPQWNGTGHYQKRIKTSVALTPQNYEWVRAEAKRRECSMADIINKAIERHAE